jgi:hypothetical protein
MKRLFITLLVCCSFAPVNTNVSMLGIRINDPASALKKITLKAIAKEQNMTRYRTANGNDFSVTIETDKVVYLENDWLPTGGKEPLLTGFTFGKTTLKEIRNKFGTNGFTYTQRDAFTTEKDLVEFNCFEFDSPNNEVLVCVTTMPLTVKATKENLAEHLKLAAIILADKKYLEEIWGKEKLVDPKYKKIKAL